MRDLKGNLMLKFTCDKNAKRESNLDLIRIAEMAFLEKVVWHCTILIAPKDYKA